MSDQLEVVIRLVEEYREVLLDVRDKQEDIAKILKKSKQDDLIVYNLTKIYTAISKVNKNIDHLRQLTFWVKRGEKK